jgi:2-C-methyl-D-erythritol 4-phosphate cytidylyltransferase
MGGVSKMLLELAGVPLVVRTLQVFQDASVVNGIIVTVPVAQVSEFQALCQGHGLSKVISVVAGGAERQDSIRNALEALSAEPDDWVAIHDGARPFITAELLESLLKAGPSFDGVLPMVAVKDTVKRVSPEGLVLETLTRSELFAAQTPQMFRFQRILSAHRWALQEGLSGTDDCALVERSGGRVGMVSGDYRNIKVTTPEDISLALAWVSPRD